MTDTETTFQRKLRERREAQERAAAGITPPAPSVPSEAFSDDLVPADERSDEDKALDDVISRIDIVDAYRRWCAKMNPEVRNGQTEGIKISCPIPGHRDSVPSAWINTDKQTWFCGGCQVGGDAYDLAAYHFNYPVPGYKDGARFHELRRDMARSMGYTFVKPPGAKSPIPVAPPEITPAPEPQSEEAEEEKADDGTVVTLFEDDEQIEFPTLEWRNIVTPNTFLDTYMKICAEDDTPEEYHFWNGLLAIGFALGRDVKLQDAVPVLGNLFICLLGNTGDGKSRSFSHLKRLLAMALPYDHADPNSKGCMVIQTVGSAEALVSAFSKPVADPSNPKVTAYYAPVRGLVEFGELSALTTRGQRQGNALKPMLHEIYDAGAELGTRSMTSGIKVAREPFGSVFTTTQPRSLRELISRGDSDSGFLNRWIFASGRQKQRLAIGGAMIDVTPAAEELKRIQGWCGFGKTLNWSPEAAARFTELFHSVFFPAKQRDDSGFLTRIDLTMKKLILLLCANEMRDEVPVHVVEYAYKIYPYLCNAYAIPAAQIGNTVQYEVMDDVRRHVQNLTAKNGKGATMRELSQRLQRKKYPPRVIKEVLDFMVNTTGEIALEITKNKTGPTTARYRYVG